MCVVWTVASVAAVVGVVGVVPVWFCLGAVWLLLTPISVYEVFWVGWAAG